MKLVRVLVFALILEVQRAHEVCEDVVRQRDSLLFADIVGITEVDAGPNAGFFDLRDSVRESIKRPGKARITGCDQEWQATVLATASENAKRQVDSKQWQIFDLYVLKSWPPREVAKALGVTIARVYLAKHSISAVVRKEVEKLERFRANI